MPKKLSCYLRRHRWETKCGADNTTYYMCQDCGAIRDPQQKRWGGGGEAPGERARSSSPFSRRALTMQTHQSGLGKITRTRAPRSRRLRAGDPGRLDSVKIRALTASTSASTSGTSGSKQPRRPSGSTCGRPRFRASDAWGN